MVCSSALPRMANRLRSALSGALLIAALPTCGGDVAGPEGDSCANALGNGAQIISGPPGPSGEDRDGVFRSLAVHPTNPDIIYVGTERNGVVRSVDGGSTWQRLRNGLRHASIGYPEVYDLAISPVDPSLVIAATVDSPGPLAGDYPSSIAGVYRSTDAGLTWVRSNCGLTNGSVAAVAFDRGNPSVAVLGVSAGRATFTPLVGRFFQGGLLRSIDAGVTWQGVSAPSGTERTSPVRIAAGSSDGRAFLLTYLADEESPTQSRGFLRSEDAGATWAPLPDALAGRQIAGFAASADGRVIYASEREPFQLWRSTDGGATWQVLRGPGLEPVAVSHGDSRIVLLFGSPGVFRSDDAGASWRLVLTVSAFVDDFEFAPSDPRIVYTATRGYDIYRSNDAGSTWQHLVNLRNSVLR